MSEHLIVERHIAPGFARDTKAEHERLAGGGAAVAFFPRTISRIPALNSQGLLADVSSSSPEWAGVKSR